MKAEGPPKILRALVNIVVAALLMLQPSPGKLAGSCVAAVALLSIGAVSTTACLHWLFSHGHGAFTWYSYGVAGAAGQGGPLCDVHHRAEPGAAALLLPLALPQIRRKVSAHNNPAPARPSPGRVTIVIINLIINFDQQFGH